VKSLFDKVWTFVIMNDKLNASHYKIICYYCNKVWVRSKPNILKVQFANNCSDASEDIRKYWYDKLANNDNTYIRSLYLQFQSLSS
jgi:hypothetical protein